MFKFLLITVIFSACRSNEAEQQVARLQRDLQQRKIVVNMLIQRLEASEQLEGEAIGIAGTPSSTYDSFKQLDGLLSDSAWLQLTYSKRPVMRVYAYQALSERNSDMAAGTVDRLSKDTASFTQISGCSSMPNTVRGYVTGTLDTLVYHFIQK